MSAEWLSRVSNQPSVEPGLSISWLYRVASAIHPTERRSREMRSVDQTESPNRPLDAIVPTDRIEGSRLSTEHV
jgi:hypothetical protein